MHKESNYETATGPIRYNLTNDFMFRATLQANPHILKGLLGALLHISPDDIEDISIENPILLGESFKDKKYILDKAYQIDRWAKLFKANTWEELRMLANGNEYMEEISNSLFTCNMDPKICKQCRDWEFEQKLRKMDERYKESLKLDIIKLEDDKAKLENDKTILENHNAKLEDANAKLEANNAQLTANNDKLAVDITQLADENARLRAQLEALLKSSSTNQNTTS